MDYQATTPVDPRVAEAMAPYWTQAFGNPHSAGHGYGAEAREAVDLARSQVADFIGANDAEICFVSGATESCNLAILGLAAAAGDRRHVVTVATEHPAVLEAVRSLQCRGFVVDVVPVSDDGILELEALREVVSERTLFVSVMLANNEIGVIQPIADVVAISHSAGAYVHTDATQAAGRVAVDVQELGVDLLSLSAHKFYGPNGIGVLYVRDAVRPEMRPLLAGGTQERGLRPGTLATPLVAGIGAASAVAQREWTQDATRMKELTASIHASLLREHPSMRTFGSLSSRIPGSLCVGFPGVLADQLVAATSDRVAISTGAACSTGSPAPSHVLEALGCSPEILATGIRISLGRPTTWEDAALATEAIGDAVQLLAGST